ncbi:hypothetical protein CTA1_1263 [Colletotrichum tanaceti]|uniref:Uncharacterized protein n=1 Tax=Colletotrichum tanaceti TaxID=1306861 RepID=A0A4U6XIC5_9PEZI|nr:hypothetical protein CTA1_1263 [Colletotrichum tanaceti]
MGAVNKFVPSGTPIGATLRQKGLYPLLCITIIITTVITAIVTAIITTTLLTRREPLHLLVRAT